LIECGALAGDRIALLLPNRVEYLQALYGIWLIGAVPVPIDSKLHPVETAYNIEQPEATIVFTIESSANAVSTHFGSAVRTIAVDGTGFAAFLAR
jgi:long-chain acyl-CoA synthetase